MGKLDIKTLTDIIRETDVEITAKRLSNDLGISYSTFARANRTGKWPPSLTDGAMLSVLDDCRTRRFSGDGLAFGDFVLTQLSMRGVDAPALEETLATGDYGTFVNELLAQAHAANPDGAVERLVQRPHAEQATPVTEPLEGDTGADPTPTDEAIEPTESTTVVTVEAEDPTEPATVVAIEAGQPVKSVHDLPQRVREFLIALPAGLLLLTGTFQVSLAAMFVWAAAHRAVFFLANLALALTPPVVGTVVDAPLAWRAWAGEHPDARLTWTGFRRVAKYGAPKGMIPGAGRFNLTVPYLLYQPVCNILSLLCCQALFSLLISLPGFVEFYCEHEWIEAFKVGVVVSYYIALAFMRDQYMKPLTGDPESEVCENPDNYLPSRAHMWANTAYLVWVISSVVVCMLGLLAFSVLNFRSMPAPPQMCLPYLQAALFFFYANLSPYAVRTRATSIGTLLPAMMALSACFATLALVCYLPSAASVALAVACVACLALTIVWTKGAIKGDMAEWLSRFRGAGFYPLVVTLTILVLLAGGLMTLAFN